MESVRYACTSCQRYTAAAIEVAKQNGKTIEIIFKAHPGALTTAKIRSILKRPKL
jgi:hypothetical protein